MNWTQRGTPLRQIDFTLGVLLYGLVALLRALVFVVPALAIGALIIFVAVRLFS